jgi:hypothetical protein
MLRSQLNDFFKRDLRAAQRMRLPWWGVWCCIVAGLPIVIFLDHYGKLYLALPILGSIATLSLLLVLKWGLRIYPWFWITMVLMTALHVPLIWFIPWTTKWVFPLVSAGIASIDFCLMLAILSAIESLMKATAADGNDPSTGRRRPERPK